MTDELVERTETVTSISRARSVSGAKNVTVDYRDSDELRAVVATAVANDGPIELVIAWIHETAPDAPLLLAEIVASSGMPVRFLHVRGSAAADPSFGLAAAAHPFTRLRGLVYQQVVLGFQVESGRSRWLTDSEISSGVLSALEHAEPVSYVGQVRPWSALP